MIQEKKLKMPKSNKMNNEHFIPNSLQGKVKNKTKYEKQTKCMREGFLSLSIKLIQLRLPSDNSQMYNISAKRMMGIVTGLNMIIGEL